MGIRSIVREVVVYLSFAFVLYVVSYGNLDRNAFFQVQHLRNFFLNPGNCTHDYTQIVTISDYWRWLEQSFAQNLRGQPWYQGDPLGNLSEFIDDKSNRLIGLATIRQLRVKLESCPLKRSLLGLMSGCEIDYSMKNEDKRSFQPGWVNATTQIYNSAIRQAFVYRTSDQLDTYFYMGEYAMYGSGGYVYEFRGELSDILTNLSQLHDLEWIDDQTRAVMIQMSLYNPNVQMFTAVTIIVELLSTGGVFPTARFEPLNFQNFPSEFYFVCAIIYLIIIVHYMIMEIHVFIRVKCAYFRRFWSYIEWGIIACSWASVRVFVWQSHESARITNLVHQSNDNTFVNFQFAVYVKDTFTFLLGFCCFFGSIKLLRLGRFVRCLTLLSDTLQHAGKDLMSFMFMLAIAFMAYVVLFYLTFVSKIWACASLLRTAQMLFEWFLFNFDASDLLEAAPFLGPFYFTLFILFIVFVCMNMFISIIIASFQAVQHSIAHGSLTDEQRLVLMMLRKFQRWIGIEKANDLQPQEDRKVQVHSECNDPVKVFPKKITQLVAVINRLYFNQYVRMAWEEKEKSMLQPSRK